MSPTHLLKWRVQRPVHILFMLAIGEILFEFNLPPLETTTMAVQVPQDKWLALGIRYLDALAQPIVGKVQLDSAPSWSNSAAIGSLDVSPDGSSATFKPSSTGTTTIRLTLSLNGKPATAELTVEVVAAEAAKVESFEITSKVIDPEPLPPAPPPG